MVAERKLINQLKIKDQPAPNGNNGNGPISSGWISIEKKKNIFSQLNFEL